VEVSYVTAVTSHSSYLERPSFSGLSARFLPRHANDFVFLAILFFPSSLTYEHRERGVVCGDGGLRARGADCVQDSESALWTTRGRRRGSRAEGRDCCPPHRRWQVALLPAGAIPPARARPSPRAGHRDPAPRHPPQGAGERLSSDLFTLGC